MTWLRNHKVRNAAKIATTAVEAAQRQSVYIVGETTSAALIAHLAARVRRLNDENADLDARIAALARLPRYC